MILVPIFSVAQFFIKGILDPEYVNSKVAAFVGLAPVIYVHHIPGLIERAMEKSGIIDALYVSICRAFPRLVQKIITTITGAIKNQTFDLTRLQVMATNEVGGTSTQNMLHWVQLMCSGRFQMFDYGTEENLERYGQPVPPAYDAAKLKEIKVPVYLFAGKSDNIISAVDFEALVGLLPEGTKHEYVEDYGHLDYIWADMRMSRYIRS